MVKKKLKRILHFTEGDCFEWAASVMEQFGDTLDANLPNFTDNKTEYYDMESGISRIRSLCWKIQDPKLRKKMTTGDWETVILYIHQEVSD